MPEINEKIDYYKDAVNTLLREMEELDMAFERDDDTKGSIEILESLFFKLFMSSRELIYKHRSLMKQYQNVKDQKSRILHDNAELSNLVKRLKEAIEEKDNVLRKIQGRKKQFKVNDFTLMPVKAENVKSENELPQSKVSPHESRQIRQREQFQGKKQRPKRIFQCTECEKHYNSANHLNRHMNGHRGIRFLCKICEKSYARFDYLKNHLCNLK